jgi:hypothetical protein
MHAAALGFGGAAALAAAGKVLAIADVEGGVAAAVAVLFGISVLIDKTAAAVGHAAGRASTEAATRLAAAQKEEVQRVAAAAAAALGPPLSLPGLKYLEVGSGGVYVGCRLADMAPQLTCLRIGYPGEH